MGDGGGPRVAPGARVRPAGEQRCGGKIVSCRRGREGRDNEESEGVGDGGAAVGGGREVAGHHVPEVCFCLLPQLLACVLFVASGDSVRLLHDLA